MISNNRSLWLLEKIFKLQIDESNNLWYQEEKLILKIILNNNECRRKKKLKSDVYDLMKIMDSLNHQIKEQN